MSMGTLTGVALGMAAATACGVVGTAAVGVTDASRGPYESGTCAGPAPALRPYSGGDGVTGALIVGGTGGTSCAGVADPLGRGGNTSGLAGAWWHGVMTPYLPEPLPFPCEPDMVAGVTGTVGGAASVLRTTLGLGDLGGAARRSSPPRSGGGGAGVDVGISVGTGVPRWTTLRISYRCRYNCTELNNSAISASWSYFCLGGYRHDPFPAACCCRSYS